MSMPPDQPRPDDPSRHPDEPEPPADDVAAAGPDTAAAADAADSAEAGEEPVDDAAAGRGLVVVGEHPDVPPPAAVPASVAARQVVQPAAEDGDPTRWWKVAVAVLAVVAVILGVLAITGRGDDSQAAAPVTPEQEAALDEVVTTPTAELDAKHAKILQLQQQSADLAATAEQLKAANEALGGDLDDAVARAGAAEAEAKRALAEAERALNDAAGSGDAAAAANRQVTALTAQVEALNREIGALTSETARLTAQNTKLEQSNTELAGSHEQATAQLAALDGVHSKVYSCTQGLADAVRQSEDPAWWEEHGDATTQACKEAQDALDAYDAKFG